MAVDSERNAPMAADTQTDTISFADVERAAVRIAGHAQRTPVLRSRSLDLLAGAELHFKVEALQRTGAFKFRGASNAVWSLPDDLAARGVVTHSSGNHAAALALAASHFDVPAYIVMPENAPASKVAAVRAYGGRITFCESTQASRESTLETLCERTGASFVPPYDHPDVIAGQGTAALELAEQLDPAPDFLLTPVGGGGLLAGCAIASKALMPDTAVIGAEPAGADDAMRSFNSGQWQPQTSPDTVADGLRTADGLGMLLHQAVPGFEKWFGVRPEVSEGLRHHVLADLAEKQA